jgi:hypothetical protein
MRPTPNGSNTFEDAENEQIFSAFFSLRQSYYTQQDCCVFSFVNVSENQIADLQRIYKIGFAKKISAEEAKKLAENFLDYFELLK